MNSVTPSPGLTIIGTSHIAQQSIKEITHAVESQNPDIIALELDKERAAALLENQKSKLSFAMISRIGVKGFLFAKIGQVVQQKLGAKVGIAPGSDMKTGLILAQKHNLQVALIDQPIHITLRKFSKTFTWKEKWRFVVDIVKGLVQPKKQLKELGLDKIDLRRVPAQDLIEKMIAPLQKRYPSIYKVLIDDRNKYMVKQLVGLMRKFPNKKILAVIGAGHEKGMRELLNKIDVVR